MIREQPEDFLTILKSYLPDPNKPIPVARREFSAFYQEFQTDKLPAVEPVDLGNGVQGFWCTVPEAQTGYTVLFFHGGGFTVGSTEDHLGLIARIARATNARVLSVDYRLAPEHLCPAATEDALMAYQYLVSHGTPPHRIIPVGISTGGTIVLELVLALRNQHMLMPPAVVCLSPVVDMQFPGASMVSNQDRDWINMARLESIKTTYLAGQNLLDPSVSPLYASFSHLPPLYIQAGSHELLFDDISALVKKVKWAGVPVRYEVWEGMFHCWQIFGEQVPEAKEAVDRIGIFVRGVSSR
jgi:monoterpene epsilon-lactone hydrolase